MPQWYNGTMIHLNQGGLVPVLRLLIRNPVFPQSLKLPLYKDTIFDIIIKVYRNHCDSE